MENQLRFVTRQSRTRGVRGEAEVFLNAIRNQLREVQRCAGADALRGCEGIAARNYFSALALLLDPEEELMAFSGAAGARHEMASMPRCPSATASSTERSWPR